MGTMAVVPPYAKVAVADCVKVLAVVLDKVVVTVRLPLFVVLELMSNLAIVPVPLIVCPVPKFIFRVKAVLLSILSNTKLPWLVKVPAPVPAISPVEAMVIPPVPILVVNALAHVATPPVLMVNPLASPVLPSMVTV